MLYKWNMTHCSLCQWHPHIKACQICMLRWLDNFKPSVPMTPTQQDLSMLHFRRPMRNVPYGTRASSLPVFASWAIADFSILNLSMAPTHQIFSTCKWRGCGPLHVKCANGTYTSEPANFACWISGHLCVECVPMALVHQDLSVPHAEMV